MLETGIAEYSDLLSHFQASKLDQQEHTGLAMPMLPVCLLPGMLTLQPCFCWSLQLATMPLCDLQFDQSLHCCCCLWGPSLG